MIKDQPIRPDARYQVERWRYPRWDNADHVVEQEELDAEEQELEAEEIQPPTAAELQQIRDDAYQEGYVSGKARGEQEGQKQGEEQGRKEGFQIGHDEGVKQGFDEGHQSGLAQAQTEIDRLKKQLGDVMTTLNQALASEQKELEQGLVSMVMQLTQNLIQQEIRYSPQIIQAMVRKVVDSLPEGSQRIHIEVHPDQVELVQELAALSEGEWQIQGNDALSPGDCWVKTDTSLVDYTLEHRFRQQISAVLEEAELSPEQLLFVLQHKEPELAETPQTTTLAGDPPKANDSIAEQPESLVGEPEQAASESDPQQPMANADSEDPSTPDTDHETDPTPPGTE